MRWLTNFYDFRFKWTATAAIGIHPTKSWLSQLVNFKNAITLKERYTIKFCFILGKNATETYGMLQTAYGSSCMNRAWVFEWHKRFNESRESVRDDERCGRSKEVRTPELIGQIKNFMDKDRRESIETISAQFDVRVGIYTQLFARNWWCGRFAWSLSLGCSEKIRKKDVVMTAGRWSSWSIQIPQFLMLWWLAMKAGSTAMTKRQSSQWKHAWPSQTQEGQKEQIHPQTFHDPFFWQHWHHLHTLGSHWTDSQQGILCWGFKGVLEEIPLEEASTLQIGSVAFRPGYAAVHNSILVTDYLTKMGIKTVPQPPYCPDLAPTDFWLFPKLKEKLRGCRYETIEEMKEAGTKVIDTLIQEDFNGVSCVCYQ